ncbi:MAG: hypothetical protein ACHQNA_14020, partial [Acidimicrobiales bacterium]
MEPSLPGADTAPIPDPMAGLPALSLDVPPADPVEPSIEAPGDAVLSPAARPDVCPFLISADGEWRLAAPAREHRCAAFTPMTSLALDKQARLCLTADHVGCATYRRSLEAREARVGATDVPERAGRWALAVTTPLIEDPGGLRARLLAIASDRRTWPAIPAVILVATLLALGFSGGGIGRPATALATTPPPASPSEPAPTTT